MQQIKCPAPPLSDAAKEVCRRLSRSSERVLLAGGAVRDHLLGREAKDIDIASSAKPEKVEKLFEKTVMVGRQFGVSKVILGNEEIEVVAFRADLEYLDGRHPVGVEFCSEKEDALRRDFTINALFYDLEDSCIVDYVSGYQDLQDSIIRTVGEASQRFAEDRLRMLRAIRFSTSLGFGIHEDCWDGILDHASAIGDVSPERIRTELEKMLVHPRRQLAYHLLTDSGLMKQILPEVDAMRDVQQPPQFHPEGDVHIHTGLVLSHLVSPSFSLAMGGLLHDIGKPRTFTDTDRIRFNMHESVGAVMAEDICHRLKVSKKEREEITYYVKKHMIFASIAHMRVAKRKRLFAEEHFEKLIDLCHADCMGAHRDISLPQQTQEMYQEFLLEPPPVEPLLTGRDLIKLEIPTGPVMGEILKRVEDARLEGLVENSAQAITLAHDYWIELQNLPGDPNAKRSQ